VIQVMSWVNRHIKRFINNTGVGYFANSSTDASQINVKLVPVQIGDGLSTKILVATRDIQPHEEILSPYKNHDKSVR
jgi:hypothetical protein